MVAVAGRAEDSLPSNASVSIAFMAAATATAIVWLSLQSLSEDRLSLLTLSATGGAWGGACLAYAWERFGLSLGGLGERVSVGVVTPLNVPGEKQPVGRD